MRTRVQPYRRSVAALLALLHLALALGAGSHRGPHLDPAIAELPADLHHHAYAFTTGSRDQASSDDPCVACHLGRLAMRLSASPTLPEAAPPDPVAFAVLSGSTSPAHLPGAGPRAPPLS